MGSRCVRWLWRSTRARDGAERGGAKARYHMGHISLDMSQARELLTQDAFKPFDPKAYLREYYSCLGEENRALLRFLNQAYIRIFSEIDTARVLEFGGGPTIYQLISAAQHAVSIDFSDYLDDNLHEVR